MTGALGGRRPIQAIPNVRWKHPLRVETAFRLPLRLVTKRACETTQSLEAVATRCACHNRIGHQGEPVECTGINMEFHAYAGPVQPTRIIDILIHKKIERTGADERRRYMTATLCARTSSGSLSWKEGRDRNGPKVLLRSASARQG